jgi:hypothetical protein
MAMRRIARHWLPGYTLAFDSYGLRRQGDKREALAIDDDCLGGEAKLIEDALKIH